MVKKRVANAKCLRMDEVRLRQAPSSLLTAVAQATCYLSEIYNKRTDHATYRVTENI